MGSGSAGNTLRWRRRRIPRIPLGLLVFAVLAAIPYLLPRFLPRLAGAVPDTAAGVSAVAAVGSATVAAATLLFTQFRESGKTRSARREGNRRHLDLVLENVLFADAERGCPLISEISDLTLVGVSRALLLPDGTRADHAYIERDIDVDVERALKNSNFVLVLGESKAGKSRTAFECGRKLYPERAFVSPATGESLRLLLSGGVSLADSVVWLDNLDRYLGPDGLDRTVLSRLLSQPNCSVVATMRSRAHAAAAPDGDTETAEWQVLQLARVVRVPRLPTASERTALAARVPHLTVRTDGLGLAEYLSAAPDLLDRYRDAEESDVARWAVVRTVIDLARCGYRAPSFEVVAAVAPAYSGTRQRELDVGEIERALDWALQPIYGASSLLTRSDEGYRPFDYLLDHSDEPIPDGTWEHAYGLASADRVLSIGRSALFAGNRRTARRCFTRASQSSEDRASAIGLYYLALLEIGDNNRVEAMRLLRRSDQLGYELAPFMLGNILQRRKRWREAEAAYERALERGLVPAAHAIAHLAGRASRPEDERRYLQLGSDGGDMTCRRHLAELDYQQGNLADAERNMTAVAERGDPVAAAFLGRIRSAEGDYDEAARWYEVAASANHKGAALDVGFVREIGGDKRAAESWYRKALAENDHRAPAYLGQLLAGEGRAAEAEPFLTEGAKKFGFAARTLSQLYLKRRDQDRAQEVLEAAAYARLPQAALRLGRLLVSTGDFDGAEAWFLREAKTGDAASMGMLAFYRLRVGDLSGSRKWAGRAAEGGDLVGRMVNTARVLPPWARDFSVRSIVLVVASKPAMFVMRRKLRRDRPTSRTATRLLSWLVDVQEDLVARVPSMADATATAPRRARRRAG